MLFGDQVKRKNSQTVQVEHEVREFQKKLAELQKEKDLLRFQPCRGDIELRKKEEAIEGLETRIKSLKEEIWVLERKRREILWGNGCAQTQSGLEKG